ncbi:MAG TPA: hypothetical protein VGC50_07085 [Gammaproteobacteria bacterium]|jgi:hypothetical protein
MAGRRKKSKKRSAANSKRPELVIFLDRNLGRTVVAERLRREGARVEIHDDHFPDQRTPDEAWLRFAGQRGWVVITPDARIRYRANEKAAVESARVRQFVLTARGLTGREIGELLAKALPKIRRLVEEFEPPFIGKITKGVSVSLYESFGKPRRK